VPTRRASPAGAGRLLMAVSRAPSRRLLCPRPCATRGPRLSTLSSAQDVSSRVVAPPYARHARGGPLVRPRRQPYVRRPKRRSTTDALPSSLAVTRARAYKRPPCSLLPHAISSPRPRRAAPLPPPPVCSLLSSRAPPSKPS
jgi:hypothetical protein